MGIQEVLTGPLPRGKVHTSKELLAQSVASPVHVIILDETHLHRVSSCYSGYYRKSRTHLSLNKDCPDPRHIQPPSASKIGAFLEVGGLHYRSNVARPEPPQSICRGCGSGIRPFSTRFSRSAHRTSSASKVAAGGSIIADERTPRSDRFVSKDRSAASSRQQYTNWFLAPHLIEASTNRPRAPSFG